MRAPRDRWHCRPPGQKCRNLPCFGHRVTQDEYLVARVLTREVPGVDWFELRPTEMREWYRRAFDVLQELRHGVDVDAVGA